MENRDQFALQRGFQINQQITATDQIQPRKRWIACHILTRKDTSFPQRLADPVAFDGLGKETLQPRGRNVGEFLFCVCSAPGLLQQRLVDVRAENLETVGTLNIGQVLGRADGQRIHLFPGRTSWNPDADRRFGRPVFHELWKHPLPERLKGPDLAKETGDIDQDVLVEGVHLLAVILCVAHIVSKTINIVYHHAPPDATAKGALFVLAEIDSGFVSQQSKKLVEFAGRAAEKILGRRLLPDTSV